MSFRLVPKLVTLNDLERRNGPLYCVISPNSVVSGAHCVSVRVRCRCKKFTFAISYAEFLVLLVTEVVTGASHPCIRMEYVWSLYRVNYKTQRTEPRGFKAERRVDSWKGSVNRF